MINGTGIKVLFWHGYLYDTDTDRILNK